MCGYCDMFEAQTRSFCKLHCKAPSLDFFDHAVITAWVKRMFIFFNLSHPFITTIISQFFWKLFPSPITHVCNTFYPSMLHIVFYIIYALSIMALTVEGSNFIPLHALGRVWPSPILGITTIFYSNAIDTRDF